MKQKTTKMITVESRGYVMTSRGRVMAPIRTPYRENVDRIWSMITEDYADVMEHLANGNKIKLTALNFDTDNSVKKEKPAATPQEKPDNGVRVVSDIKTSNNGVPMRTGDVFYTNPAEAQAHHEKDADNNKSAENGAVDNNEKAAEEKPAAAPQEKPEGNTGNNNQQKQQNGKPQNNQNNNGKNKHNKGNKNNQNRGQAQIFPKEDKKDETIEPHDDGKPVEPVTEPTTGADLAVTPETV